MAEIENLTIAINSSANGALTNIDKLASSLEKLNGVLNGGSFKSACNIVNALKPLERLGNIKISSSIPKRLMEIKAASDSLAHADFSGLDRLAAALQKFKGLEGIRLPKILPAQTSIPGAAAEESGPIDSGMVHVQASTESASFSLMNFINHVKEMIASNKTASAVLKGMSTAFGYLGGAARGVVGAIGGFFKSLGRVAFYRAIRAVLKDLVQGFKDLYGYSKANGTQFAKSMDTLTTSVTYLRNSIVAMAAPIVNALAPAFDYLVDRIVNALNWVNQLISALSGADTYTVAKKVARTWESTFDSSGKSASSANKKIKELKRTILGFDEINKLNANNDTSGRSKKTSSPYTDGYLNMFETRKVSSGFKGFGDALHNAIQDVLTRIQMTVSLAFLALGAILTFSGANIPLGIALMATGAIGIVTAIAEKWDGLDPKIKRTISVIAGIVGVAFLALGAILAFSGANIPLGIGLMAMGALDLGYVAKMNWGAIEGFLQGPLGKVVAIISGAVLLLGIVALLTGNIPLGIGLLALGAGGLAVWGYANWDNIKQFGINAAKKVREGWDSVSNKVVEFRAAVVNEATKWWENVQQWWNETTLGKTVNPIIVEVKNTSAKWWADVQAWWSETTVSKYVDPFLVTVKNMAGTWWELVKSWWIYTVTGDPQEFFVTVKDTATEWWETVEALWTDENGNKSAGVFLVKVRNTATEWLEDTKTFWSEILNEKGTQFDKFIVSVKNTGGDWFASVRLWWKNALGINDGASYESFVVKVRDTATEWFSNVRIWWKNILGDNLGGDFISFAVQVKNTAWQWWQDVQKWWNDTIGTLWLKLDIKLPHFSINWSTADWYFGSFDYPSGLNVDWYAKGGILDDPVLFGMMNGHMLGGGEAGKEAVLPLENHTEWMDTLASRVWENGMQRANESSNGNDDEPMIDLMRQLLVEMRKFNDKKFSAEITTNSIADGTNRMNRRAGTVVIPVN